MMVMQETLWYSHVQLALVVHQRLTALFSVSAVFDDECEGSCLDKNTVPISF